MKKKMVILTLCAMMAVTAAGCGNQKGTQANDSANSTVSISDTQADKTADKTTDKASDGAADIKIGENVQIPNPFVDCESMEDAKNLAGFDMVAPDEITGYDKAIIQAVENDMIQVIYESGENRILIRKAAGSDDISGDYNVYEKEDEYTVDNVTIKCRSNDNKNYVITWTDGDFTYAIDSDAGIDEELTQQLVKLVK